MRGIGNGCLQAASELGCSKDPSVIRRPAGGKGSISCEGTGSISSMLRHAYCEVGGLWELILAGRMCWASGGLCACCIFCLGLRESIRLPRL
jgi:hypothetical protein